MTISLPRNILLVSMPLIDPKMPNLAIEELASIAKFAGKRCDVLYGSLLLPPTVSDNLIIGMSGPSIFTPHYYRLDPELIAEEVVKELFRRKPEQNSNQQELKEAAMMDYLISMEAAEVCLDLCIDAIPIATYYYSDISILRFSNNSRRFFL